MSRRVVIAAAGSIALHAGLFVVLAGVEPAPRPPSIGPKGDGAIAVELVSPGARGPHAFGGGEAPGASNEGGDDEPALRDAAPRAPGARPSHADPKVDPPRASPGAGVADTVERSGTNSADVAHVTVRPEEPARSAHGNETAARSGEGAIAANEGDARARAHVAGGEVAGDRLEAMGDGGRVAGPLAGEGAGRGTGSGLVVGEGTGRGTGTSSGSGSGGGANGAGAGDWAVLEAHLRAHASRCYPPSARRRSIQGGATIHFCVGDDGSPAAVRLEKSSGSSLLDRAAVDCVVRGAAPLPGPRGCISVPVWFRL